MTRGALVVDGANVVGSIPDGWWRDRAGAARRLHAELAGRLAAGELAADRVELVLEGRARPALPEGEVDGVWIVHAPGEGDDEIVARCTELAGRGPVAVATADRGLLARLAPLGVTVIGPRSVRGLPPSD